MTAVFRLVRADRVQEALSGEGARLYGGRWNRPGLAVVYASESRALAVLETFVHLTLEARAMRFVLYTLKLPPRARLKRQWARLPRSVRASQEVGSRWIQDKGALALVVPSFIVPQEANYVLNVSHPQFGDLVATHEPFSFDERLWRSRSA